MSKTVPERSIPHKASPAGLIEYYAEGSRAGTPAHLEGGRFSWWMTSMLHAFPDAGDFGARMQLAEFDSIAGSPAAATTVAENYVGLPF
ncbi:hypothetical protein [Xanthobacter autotrophicus]|uniref:hypothetical protein n=1 Tax=Xanthobacter autotrophicus TaxID=280 RepID=UPI0024A766C3|nr:hypothetical protein [Xanthobacter autotrophicus]MDI4656781.1 hypothetical protein [Xanthobacter autotrophicus]